MNENIKRYNQHFLKNEVFIKKECLISNINKDDIILEIGTGLGNLTIEILKYNPKKIISVEKDKNLFEKNKNKFEKFNNIELINEDILNVINRLNFNKVISNIPYNITEQLLFELLKKNTKNLTLIIGKNYYVKILKSEKLIPYLIKKFYDIKLIEEIKGDNFEPKTKVKSVLINMKLNDEKKNLEKKILCEIVKKFNKKIYNFLIFTLVDLNKIGKKKAEEIFKEYSKNNKLNEQLLNKKVKQINLKELNYLTNLLSYLIKNLH